MEHDYFEAFPLQFSLFGSGGFNPTSGFILRSQTREYYMQRLEMVNFLRKFGNDGSVDPACLGCGGGGGSHQDCRHLCNYLYPHKPHTQINLPSPLLSGYTVYGLREGRNGKLSSHLLPVSQLNFMLPMLGFHPTATLQQVSKGKLTPVNCRPT